MDLHDVSLNDLLAGLSQSEPAQPHVVDKWLTAQGIYPGTMRVRAVDLYAQFVDWCAAQHDITEKIPEIRQWGMEMSRRFKKERSTKGNRYYISRSKEPKIPEELENNGG